MDASILSRHPVLKQRLARKWSQTQLAERVGVSRAAISAIEGQRFSPSVATALALAQVFECSVEELFVRGRTCASPTTEWAWAPRAERSRHWEASRKWRL